MIAGHKWEIQRILDRLMCLRLRTVIVSQRGVDLTRVQKVLSHEELENIHLLKLRSPSMLAKHQELITWKMKAERAELLILDVPDCVRDSASDFKLVLDELRCFQTPTVVTTDIAPATVRFGGGLLFPAVQGEEETLFACAHVEVSAEGGAMGLEQSRYGQNAFQTAQGAQVICGERRMEQVASQRLCCVREGDGLRVAGVGDWCGQLRVD